jgi:hypothetical protein
VDGGTSINMLGLVVEGKKLAFERINSNHKWMARSDKSIQKSLLIIFKQEKIVLTLTDHNSFVVTGDP